MERSHNTVRAEYKAHAGIQLRLPVLHCFVHSVCLVMLSEEVIAHNFRSSEFGSECSPGTPAHSVEATMPVRSRELQ